MFVRNSAPAASNVRTYGTQNFRNIRRDEFEARRNSIVFRGNIVKFAVIVTFILVAVIAVVTSVTTFAVTGTATDCTVTRTETAIVGTGSDMKAQKRVYTQGCNGENSIQVFTADDSLLDGQFNSADIYGSIQEGHTYDFTTRGARIPFLNGFPNITSVTSVQ
jgi:hypothetical protein